MLKDGFQIHNVGNDSGANNVFHENLADGPASGFGFNVDVKATGTVIGCDNVISGAWTGGLANMPCQ